MTSSPVGLPAAAPPASTRVLAPAKTRVRLADLRSYGPLVRALASRDLKARYKQSALGPAWVVFQPLALLAAFTVGFRSVAHVHTDGVPYVLFALAGLAVWTYFQAVTMVATGSIVNNYALVRWTSCPRLALPLATVVSSLPSFVIPGLAAVIAAGAAGYLWIGWLLVPLMCVWLALLVGVCAILLSAITVRARDVLSVVPFMLQVLLFLSPVAYATSTLSPALRALIAINPLTGLIEAWRWSLLGIHASLTAVIVSLVLTGVGAAAGWRLFARLEVRMADEI
jgi:ABC-type polysaccharide/polyol phosphate export permease